MKKSLLYITLGLSLFLGSCSDGAKSELDPSIPIYQSLGVEYDVTANLTHVGADFKVQNASGESLRMQSDGVTFNGESPTFIGTGDYMYVMQLEGLPQVKFVLNRMNVGSFTNTASLDDVDPIALPDTFSTLGPVTQIYWDGDPISDNEYVVAHITYEGGQSTQSTELQGAIGIKLVFDTQDMKGEKATVALSRVKSLPIQESNGAGGGVIKVSYTSSKQVVIK